MSSSDLGAGPTDFPTPFDRERAMEMVWENSLLNRNQMGGEIMIPFNVVALIGEENLDILHERLRVLTGGDVERFDDHQFGGVRLIPIQHSPQVEIEEWARLHISQQLSEAASQGLNLYPDLQKIPRPPNKFILYRQHHHKAVTAANPGVPNTAISRIIADMWKGETPAVREEYKMLAQMAKEEHSVRFPDYQYAPRRPHEKPRRRARIHPSALTWMWGTKRGAAIMEDANARPRADGWVPVTRDLVQELESRHLLFGPEGLASPPLGTTQEEFQELIQRQVELGANAPQLTAASSENFDPLDGIDEEFLEEILNFDGN